MFRGACFVQILSFISISLVSCDMWIIFSRAREERLWKCGCHLCWWHLMQALWILWRQRSILSAVARASKFWYFFFPVGIGAHLPVLKLLLLPCTVHPIIHLFYITSLLASISACLFICPFFDCQWRRWKEISLVHIVRCRFFLAVIAPYKLPLAEKVMMLKMTRPFFYKPRSTIFFQ
jgi:hypothetical protein